MAQFLLALICSALYDALNVTYQRAVQAGATGRAVLFSMLMATASVSGLADLLIASNKWIVGAGLVLGYGIGTYLGMKLHAKP